MQWIVLAVVQAFAEVLPIGAAAHFSVLNAWLGLPPGSAGLPGLAIGIRLGLAVGTAAYFWQDIADMARGLIKLAKGKRDPAARLAFQLIVATVPSIVAAVLIQDLWGSGWQTPAVTAWAAVVVSFLLLLFDRACMTVKRVEHAGYGDAVLLGLAEACAFVPGVGRIAAGAAVARLLGYERQEAARFSFLISIPVLIGSAAWNVPALSGQPFPTASVLVGFFAALLVALALLSLLMGWLRRRSFTPFVVYRVMVGGALLVIVYGWI